MYVSDKSNSDLQFIINISSLDDTEIDTPLAVPLRNNNPNKMYNARMMLKNASDLEILNRFYQPYNKLLEALLQQKMYNPF